MKSSLMFKAASILEAICASKHPVAIKELTGILDLPLPTVSRLCADLIEIGLLEKTDYHHLVPGKLQGTEGAGFDKGFPIGDSFIMDQKSAHFLFPLYRTNFKSYLLKYSIFYRRSQENAKFLFKKAEKGRGTPFSIP